MAISRRVTRAEAVEALRQCGPGFFRAAYVREHIAAPRPTVEQVSAQLRAAIGTELGVVSRRGRAFREFSLGVPEQQRMEPTPGCGCGTCVRLRGLSQ